MHFSNNKPIKITYKQNEQGLSAFSEVNYNVLILRTVTIVLITYIMQTK